MDLQLYVPELPERPSLGKDLLIPDCKGRQRNRENPRSRQPGKQMQINNVLSRLSPEEDVSIPDLKLQILDAYPQFSSECLQKI